MKNIMLIFTIFCFVGFTKLLGQEIEQVENPKISIISAEVIFVKTVVRRSNNRHIPGSNIVQPVVTYHKSLLFNLSFSVFLPEKNDVLSIPLDVRLTSPNNKIRIYRIEDYISYLKLNELYDYEIDILTNETGWFIFEVGEFKKSNNLIYDKQSIYFDN